MLCIAQYRVPLADLIDVANKRGYNIIYSSQLVPPKLTVERDNDVLVTLGELRRHLQASGLRLEKAGTAGFVVRAEVADAQETASTGADEMLPSVAFVLEEVVVSSSRYSWFASDSTPDFSMSGDELSRRAVVGNDVIRVLNQLPGSASVGVSARPRVRGGRDNETLIEFDGVRLYNPFHFGAYNSLYSALDSRLFEQLDFYTAAYPVSFGDRLSAALIITPPVGASQEPRRELGLGLFQMSYLQSGRMGDGDFFLSARRNGTEMDSLSEEVDLGHPSFGDLFMSYARDDAEGASWRFNALWFGDDLRLSSEDESQVSQASSSNTYLWARQERSLSPTLERVSSLGAGRTDRERSVSVDDPAQVIGYFDFEQSLSFLFANQDWTLSAANGVFSAGFDYRYLLADYDYQSAQEVAAAFAGLSNIARDPEETIALERRGHQLASYANWKRELGSRMFLEAGLRLDAQRYLGSWNVEPGYRLGLLYRLNDNADFRVAVGRYSQAPGLHEIDVADLDTQLYDPQVANHVVTAANFSMPTLGLTLRLEAYAKVAEEVSPYYDNLSNPFTLVPELRPDRIRITPDSYEATGVEADLRGDWGAFGGWLNFAYSSAKDEFDGRSVRRSWDQARTFNAGFDVDWGAWELSAAASFHEGWLTTPLTLEDGLVTAGLRNSEQFDHYLSIDTKGVRRWSTRHGEVRLEIGVSNLGDRDNQIGTVQRLSGGGLESTAYFGLPRTLFADVYWSF